MTDWGFGDVAVGSVQRREDSSLETKEFEWNGVMTGQYANLVWMAHLTIQKLPDTGGRGEGEPMETCRFGFELQILYLAAVKSWRPYLISLEIV